MDDVVYLEVSEDESQPKRFSLVQIHELQSRLMLLGIDMSNDDVDSKQFEKRYFVEVCFEKIFITESVKEKELS